MCVFLCLCLGLYGCDVVCVVSVLPIGPCCGVFLVFVVFLCVMWCALCAWVCLVPCLFETMCCCVAWSLCMCWLCVCPCVYCDACYCLIVCDCCVCCVLGEQTRAEANHAHTNT